MTQTVSQVPPYPQVPPPVVPQEPPPEQSDTLQKDRQLSFSVKLTNKHPRKNIQSDFGQPHEKKPRHDY